MSKNRPKIAEAQHANAVRDELAKYPDDVGAFMRQQFNLEMYPIAFTTKFAAALHAAFQAERPSGATCQTCQALRQEVAHLERVIAKFRHPASDDGSASDGD